MKNRVRLTLGNEKGMALILSIVVMAATAMLALGVTIDNTIEMRIAGNQLLVEKAFRNAESGLEVGRYQFSKKLREEALKYPNYPPPSDDPDPPFEIFVMQKVFASASDNEITLDDKTEWLVTAQYPDNSTTDAFMTSVGKGADGTQQEIKTRVVIDGAHDPGELGELTQAGHDPNKTNVNRKDKEAVNTSGGAKSIGGGIS